jgi:hypothetical protein
VHFFVARTVVRVTAGGVDDDFPGGLSCGGVNPQNTAFEIKGALNGVQSAIHHVVNFALGLIEREH